MKEKVRWPQMNLHPVWQTFFADNPWFSRNTLYSDGSTYQNRHSTLSKALLHFAVTHNVEVEQKKNSGKSHTLVEVDFVHGCVERHLKNVSTYMYVPVQYLDKIKLARTKPFPFRVKFLHHDFFKETCIQSAPEEKQDTLQ